MFSIFVADIVSVEFACIFRYCSPHCCSASMGQHDHGYSWCTCSGYWTSYWWLNEVPSRWKKRELHQQCNVEEYFRTIIISVCYHMVSSKFGKSSLSSWWPRFWFGSQHTHFQCIRLLPGNYKVLLLNWPCFVWSSFQVACKSSIIIEFYDNMHHSLAGFQWDQLKGHGEDQRVPWHSKQLCICWRY